MSKPLKQYQLIAMALHKAKPDVPSPSDLDWGQGANATWDDCVEKIADELSDSAYRHEFILIANTGVVDRHTSESKGTK